MDSFDWYIRIFVTQGNLADNIKSSVCQCVESIRYKNGRAFFMDTTNLKIQAPGRNSLDPDSYNRAGNTGRVSDRGAKYSNRVESLCKTFFKIAVIVSQGTYWPRGLVCRVD